MNVVAAIRTWSARRKPRAVYFNLTDQLDTPHRQLAATVDPQVRAKLLRTMADLESKAAQIYTAAFGPDPIGSEPGRDMADATMETSKLYRVLADVEHVVACNGRVGRHWRFYEWGEQADAVLDRMAATPGLLDRMNLLDDLYDAVLPAVGGQAAEAVACLHLTDAAIDAATLSGSDA